MGESLLRQAELLAADDAVVVDHVEHRLNVAAVAAHLHLCQRLESLGPVNRTIAAEIGDVFLVGVDIDPAQAEAAKVMPVFCLHGSCANPVKWSSPEILPA
ncbi:hypothetical protein [Methylogaea oryzae]|uniref:hypothetical protein n=1 Tax=Methylogaea oryzae TaxID=1295382 RepID=UPI0020D1B5FA|nr:hypothetical protein [Methylogaea oryzae]